MITYSTEFPIDAKHTVDQVLDLAREWILGSPYTAIKKDDLSTLKNDGESRVKIASEELIFGKAKSENCLIGGIRYSKIDADNYEWITSIICSNSNEKNLLAIQVSCEAMNTATFMPSAKKPYFVRLALKRLQGGMDGSIPVTDRPFFFEEDEVDVAAKIINGTAENRLPIIYISAINDGKYIVNCKRLASHVSGMAHVFVEPSRHFSANLKNQTASRNPYGGTVAVFWPESSARKSYFLDEKHTDKESSNVEFQIARDIRVALSNRRSSSVCTWLHLKELISRGHYESLKAQGSTTLDEYIKAFDEELGVKTELLMNAEMEIERLNQELRRSYSAQSQIGTGGLIVPGLEQSLYQNEIKAILVDALNDSLAKFVPESRQAHVLEDIIKHNPVENDIGKTAAKVKNIFHGYTNMNAKIRSEMIDLGFDLSEEGKHFKAIFKGDGRYAFTISKSSSDHRTGKNLAADINKILFKSLG